MWHARKNGPDVLRSAREAGLARGVGSKCCCLQRGRREKGREGRKRDNLYLLGLLRSAASYFYIVFSFRVSKSHCTIL